MLEAHRAVQFLQAERNLVRSIASSHVTTNKSKSFCVVEVHENLWQHFFLLKSGGVQSIIIIIIISRCNKRWQAATYESEENEEAGDVADHSAKWDLQRTEHLERRHQVRRPRYAQHIGDGKQDIRDDLWVIRLPVKPRCPTQPQSSSQYLVLICVGMFLHFTLTYLYGFHYLLQIKIDWLLIDWLRWNINRTSFQPLSYAQTDNKTTMASTNSTEQWSWLLHSLLSDEKPYIIIIIIIIYFAKHNIKTFVHKWAEIAGTTRQKSALYSCPAQ